MASATGSTTFGLLWCSFPPFRPSQKPETLRKSKQALEMAAEGADFTKSTTFGLLWGSPHFGGPKCRKCRKRKQTLEMASGKGAGSPQNRQVLGFCGVPPAFRLPPDAGNPGNFEESLEMAPAKKSRLDKIDHFWAFVGSPSGNRQLLGFRPSQKPETPANPNRPKEMASGKGADSTKSTSFGLLWGPLHFGGPQMPEIQEIPKGPWKWLPQKERTLQN